MSYKTDYEIERDYEDVPLWDSYWKQLEVEYNQSIEEGLDIEKYKDVILSVSKMDDDKYKAAMSEVIFKLIENAEMREDYMYFEPSHLDKIRALRKPYKYESKMPDEAALREKISGAWYGRICGCLLGKVVEGMLRKELIPFLKASDNYPMHRYIYSTDIPADAEDKYEFKFNPGICAD